MPWEEGFEIDEAEGVGGCVEDLGCLLLVPVPISFIESRSSIHNVCIGSKRWLVVGFMAEMCNRLSPSITYLWSHNVRAETNDFVDG